MSVDYSQLKIQALSVGSSNLFQHAHTAYNLSFFLLRSPLMMNGQPAQIASDDGYLTLSCRYPLVSITFDSLITEVDAVVKKYGLEGVSNYWCEEAPLFELKLSSQHRLRKFLRLQNQVQDELTSRITATLAQRHQSADPIVVLAHTEVYMLTPRPERKDAEVVLVTCENLDTCAAVWREREVFDFGALFRALKIDRQTIPYEGKVTLKLLDQELHEISEWFGLGLHLGVPVAELQAIRYNPTLRSIPQFRIEMLTARIRMLPELSWSHTVLALMAVGRESLAHKIALKYGVPVPSTYEKKLPQLDTQSQMSTSLQQELFGQVEKLRREVETEDREVVEKSSSLQEARRQKGAVQERQIKVKEKIRESHTKTMKLLHKKVKLEKKLQLREQELQLLRTGQEKHSQQLWSIIQNKEEEVRELQQRLFSVESELASEKKVTQDLREKLHQATVELVEKTAQEQERENTNLLIKTHLESERQRMDQLVMLLTSASTSKDQYIKEIEHQLSNARAERDSNAKEVSQHKITIARREGEIQSLQLQLYKQEALIQNLEQEPAIDSAKQELELAQKLFQVTSEVAGLREKLQKAEEGKQDAVRKMEAAQVKSEIVQHQMAELGEQKHADDHTATKDESVGTLPSPSRQPHAHPPSGLQLPLTLRWRQHKDLPCEMESPHCVMVEGKLYIGGGYTYTFSDDEHTIWQYESRQWSKLKRYKWRWFGMAAVKRQLTIVGGTSTLSLQTTSDIAVWDREGAFHTWTHPYPPMPTRRYWPAVATYNQWLVVAGGHVYLNDLAAVDVLDTDNHQWLSASSLSVECSDVTTAILQDELYLVGGRLNKTLVANLPDIIHSSTSAITKTWRTLPAPPLERSAAITIHRALLAVGGCYGNEHSTAIHAYQPATNSWSKVGDLPSPRSRCACTLLANGELLVAGGVDSNGKLTARVDVAVM